MKNIRVLLQGVFFLSVLVILSWTVYASAQSGGTDTKIVYITFGPTDVTGRPPSVFSDPILLVQKGDSIKWQNLDTEAHQLTVEKREYEDSGAQRSKQIFKSDYIQPMKTASYTFKDAGVYHVNSSTVSTVTGVIVVADNLATMTDTDTANDSVNVELSWYPPTPRIGEETYFRVQFPNKQTGANHEHVDYTFSILNSTGSQIENGSLEHAADGQDFVSYVFKSEGSFSPIVTVRGVSFVPINPDEARFNIMVTPEFQVTYLAAIMAGGTAFAFLAKRTIQN